MEDQIVEPGVVEGLPRSSVVKVLCGALHTAAVTRAGQVFTWGSGESGALGHGSFHASSCTRAALMFLSCVAHPRRSLFRNA